MTWIQSMQKAIEYMECRITEEITMEEIAASAYMSPYQFQRMFRLLTDISAAEYLRRRRLTLAAQELKISDQKIIDLGFKYGYETPESFSKAFRKHHGCSPRQIRFDEGKITAYNRMMIQVSLKGAEPMHYQIIEKEAFQMVGVKGSFAYENEENLNGIPNMWERLNAKGTTEELLRKNNGKIKGVLGVCVDRSKQEGRTMDYWIGVDHQGLVDDMEVLRIPASKWAVFEVSGAMPVAVQNVWKQIYTEWFPSSGYKSTGGPELEVYAGGDPYSEDYKSTIWVPVQ
ncbi:AraC family transcriptional regulator [Halobacillus litoralis]|uniref:AraC family transcriptional regulator n=1 Tax=Halobacillus litoralis TaxID=45668 RepID=UPI001CFF396C|nr:GyrI-like domain-containing protein [Halobacillus litoralis]